MRNAVLAVVMCIGMTTAGTAARTLNPPLLPMPSSLSKGIGSFSFQGAAIAATDPGERAAAERLTSLLSRSGGTAPAYSTTGQIRFHRDPKIRGNEAYRLVVKPSGVNVSASGDAGLYYGAETLWQLMASSKSGDIPALTMNDHPAFAWRGLMLDSARHFQSVDYVKQLIDRMAIAKLNTFHWHLTDDQGWRIQIDKYPLLTSVGAWRREAGAAGFDPTGAPLPYGGYYSKDDIRSVVAYARDRHITVVPEIEMPGHATAMIAAYPELASIPNPPNAPSYDWGILPNLLSPEDSTFTFIDNVMDEVMELFPSKFIHVGGDEAVKDQWKANPAIQAKIKALGLKDEDALQGWFTARVGKYLASHGRRLIGWDEILHGQVPPDAAIMSWHGLDGAVAAAKTGHDTVLAPAPILYLDNRQSDSDAEPPGRGEIIGWQDVYKFDPAPPSLSAAQRRHILGMQGNLWTEHLRTVDYTDRMIWPRAAIIAELAWSNPKKNWNEFSGRLVAAMDRWDQLKLGYNRVPLEPEAELSPGHNGASVKLRQPAGIGTLRYAIGTSPTSASPAYSKAVTVTYGQSLFAQSFRGDRPLGPARSWVVTPQLTRSRTAAQMELCGTSIPLRLEDDGATDGKRVIHWSDIMRPCWIWHGASLDGITALTAEVGQQPFNFAIGDDIKSVEFDAPATPAGELVVRRDGCKGPIIANIPMAPATLTSGNSNISGPVTEQSGTHDLCITFTQREIDPFWVLQRLALQ